MQIESGIYSNSFPQPQGCVRYRVCREPAAADAAAPPAAPSLGAAAGSSAAAATPGAAAAQPEILQALDGVLDRFSELISKLTETLGQFAAAIAGKPAEGRAPLQETAAPAESSTTSGAAAAKGTFRGFLNSLGDAFDQLLGEGSFLGKAGKNIKSVTKMFTSVFSGGFKKALSSIL
jgi:hypothetical protein